MQEDWKNSRRNFVKTVMLTGLALQLPWIQSCASEHKKIPIPKSIEPLALDDFLNLHTVIDILFPNDGNGPGAIQLKADQYILWILNDVNLDPDSRSFLIDNLLKLNNESKLRFRANFQDMNRSKQETYIAELAETEWSKNWLSKLLTFIFEALLLDPQYGVNPENIGWKWLEYYPGYPRPTTEQLYPTILAKKHEV